MPLFRRKKHQPVETLLTLLDAESWAESKRIVENHRDLLLTDTADATLAYWLGEYRKGNNENAIRTLEVHRKLLIRCRREGIDAAFADHLPFDSAPTVSSAKWDQINEAVARFVFFAQTWAERKQLVENHRDLLLTDTADATLAALLTQFRDDKDGIRNLEECRKVLIRCRREGIDAAFADRLYLDR